MFKPLTDNQIREILKNAGLDSSGNIEKIAVGFSNDVYTIADKFILKAGKSNKDFEFLKRELFFCDLFKNKLPVAKVIYSDLSGEKIERPYIIYEKIYGDNLYNKWHEYDDEKRKSIIKNICGYLKVINHTSSAQFMDIFSVSDSRNWKKHIMDEIDSHLQNAISNNLIEKDFVIKIREFIAKREDSLNEQKMALVYFDPHFDNFIVDDGEIVGMLDFERIDYLSIDYVLDLVKRMVEHPKKYASEEAEQYVKEEDYQYLLEWYKEFYPEIFDFNDLEKRLDLYALRYVLKMLVLYPEYRETTTRELKEILE